MKSKVNWKRFVFIFAVLQICFLSVGCSASILGAISALIPGLVTLVNAAVSFVMALEGKTVPANVSAAVQKWSSNIAGLISNLQGIITAASGKATSGVIVEIEAVMQQIQSSITSILSEFNVKDSATVSKFTSLINLGLGVVATILALIPATSLLLTRTGVTKAQLVEEDALASAHVKNGHKGMQAAYKIIRDTPTENGDVNVALLGMPAALP
jgi:hypothetical protein